MKMKTSVLLLCGILEKAETGKPVMIYTYSFEGKTQQASDTCQPIDVKTSLYQQVRLLS